MEIFLIMGAIVGTFLFGTKLAFMYLICPPNVRHWIHLRPKAGAGLDLIMSYGAMHVALMAGGSLVAMITMVTFGAWSMIYIWGSKTGAQYQERKKAKEFQASHGLVRI